MTAKASDRERFFSKVHKTSQCWEWQAYKDRNGYGVFGLDRKVRKAHRVSYEFANGPVPAGMPIDHICHNPGCVNPEHLRKVTTKQNAEHRRGAQSNSKSGVRGVSWDKTNRKWQAQVKHEGRVMKVGRYCDLAEAEAAVIAKRNELFTHNDLDRVA